MYLDLPGFGDPAKPRDPAKARINQIANRYAKPPKTPHKRYKFKSENIDDRISWIEYEINVGKRLPQVREIAAQAVSGVPPREWKKEATALFEWTRKNVRYTLDPHNVELFQSTRRSVEVGIGDCDDQAITLGSLLQSVGIPIRLRVIGLKGSDKFQHIYVLAGLPPDGPREWFPLDASREFDAGWELPESQRGLLQDYDVADYDPEK